MVPYLAASLFPLKVGESLGIYTKLPTTYHTSETTKKRIMARRLERYELQAVARDLLPDERVSTCLRMIVPNRRAVQVWYSPQVLRAHYKNLVVCGSIWNCPVCAAKVTERRRLELRAALKQSSFEASMITVTLQHDRRDALKDLVQVLRKSWTRTRTGRVWSLLQERNGFEGYITALEVTHGARGWHPHLHVLALGRWALSDLEREVLQEQIAGRFGRYLVKLGGYSSAIHGVKVSGRDVVSEYVTKWGLPEELTKAPTKTSKAGGRHPFDLLRACRDGDRRAGALFVEYAQAMKGRKQLSWSRGLRDRLGIGKDKSDLELAQEKASEGDFLLASINRRGWSIICKNALRGELLEVASRGDAVRLAEFLLDFGIVGEGVTV